MMAETAVHALLLDIREALTIWFLLVALVIVTLACLTAPARRDQPRRGPTRAARLRLHRDRLIAEAEELRRYADEIATAASRAAVTAQYKQAEWVAALRAQEATWRAYDTADAVARRATRAAAIPAPPGLPTSEEFEDRGRYLYLAATAAHRRGELSTQQLVDVMFRHNGWDPHRHPVDQEVALCQLGRDRLLRAYRAASAVESAAWHAAEVAAAARRSLYAEAAAAAQRARQARSRLAPRSHRRWSTAITGRLNPRKGQAPPILSG